MKNLTADKLIIYLLLAALAVGGIYIWSVQSDLQRSLRGEIKRNERTLDSLIRVRTRWEEISRENALKIESLEKLKRDNYEDGKDFVPSNRNAVELEQYFADRYGKDTR